MAPGRQNEACSEGDQSERDKYRPPPPVLVTVNQAFSNAV